jgi:hypothetical protein
LGEYDGCRMECVVCTTRSATMGALCDDCRDDVTGPFTLMPEQVLVTALQPTPGALVDAWGRVHRLDARAFVGRQMGGAGVCLIDGSVSRHHAYLALDSSRNVWSIGDLGSKNGTLVNGEAVAGGPMNLQTRDTVSFGQVAFYFLADAQYVPPMPLDPRAAATVPSDIRHVVPDVEVVTHADTFVGRRLVPMRLYEPSGGGGGVVELRGHRFQLSPVQFELLTLLARRMITDSHVPDPRRGFVPTSELLQSLSWETPDPGDANVKQVVRKLRAAMSQVVGDLIESRRGFGYRLRVIPLFEDA